MRYSARCEDDHNDTDGEEIDADNYFKKETRLNNKTKEKYKTSNKNYERGYPLHISNKCVQENSFSFKETLTRNIQTGDILYLKCRFTVYINNNEIPEHRDILKYIPNKNIEHMEYGIKYTSDRYKYIAAFPHARNRLYYFVLNSFVNPNTRARFPDSFIKLIPSDYPKLFPTDNPSGYLMTDTILMHEISLTCLNFLIKTKEKTLVDGNLLDVYNYGKMRNLEIYNKIYEKIISPSHTFLLKSSSRESLSCVLKSIEELTCMPPMNRKSNLILDKLRETSEEIKRKAVAEILKENVFVR